MNTFWSDNGTKILGGMTAGLGTLQTFITTGAFDKLLSAVAIGWLGIIVGFVTAVIGGTTIVRGFNTSAQVKIAQAMETAIKASPEAGFARLRVLCVLAMVSIAAMVFMSGCVTDPTTGKHELSATGKVAIEEVAGIAVGRLLRESAHATEVAARVRSVAMELQTVTDTLSVAELTAKLDKRIDEHVSDPYDRSDLHRLLNLSSALLKDYVGAGQLKPEDLVKVSEFMGYVIAALPPPLTRT